MPRSLRLLPLALVLLGALAASPARAQRAPFAPDLRGGSPPAVASGLVGSWWEGTLATIQFYDPSTGTWAAPNGTGTFLILNADGTFRAGGILNVTTGVCTSTLMVDERGTYKATAAELVLARQTGNSRASNTCSTQVYTRVLDPETVAYGYVLGQSGGTETLTRTRDGAPHSTMRRWAAAPPPVPNPLVLRSYEPSALQQVFFAESVAPLDTGFVFGSNVWRDKRKATLLRLPAGMASGQIDQVSVYFGYKKPGAPGLFSVSIHAGTAESGPVGPPLATRIVDIADIHADADLSTPSAPTVLALDQPVTVGATFFVSIVVAYDDPIHPNWLVDRIALASSPLIEARVPEVWEQWADNSWHNASDVWTSPTGQPGTGTAGWHLWVEARLTGLTTPSEPTAEPAAALTLRPVAPNPVRGAGTLRFDLPAAAHATLEVMDVTGRVVAVLLDGALAAGAHEAALDASGLAPGVYVARLRAAGAAAVQRLTVVR